MQNLVIHYSCKLFLFYYTQKPVHTDSQGSNTFIAIKFLTLPNFLKLKYNCKRARKMLRIVIKLNLKARLLKILLKCLC